MFLHELFSGYQGLVTLTLLMLGIDLLLTRGTISFRSAAVWSVFWFSLAFLFAGAIYLFWPEMSPTSQLSSSEATTAFITGYLLEKSLSVDNLFVFALIFSQFNVPDKNIPRILMLGIVGALLLRGIMISVGAPLIAEFHVILYLFGFFLIWTGVQMWRQHDDQDASSFSDSFAVRLVKRFLRVSPDYHGNKLFIRDGFGILATPMLVVVIVIAMTDVMFALDSIPAIFAVTQEAYLVLAANVFALLGLRSLYFVLGGMLTKFAYLHHTLAFMLCFIGTKMLLIDTPFAIATPVSLGVILASLVAGIGASVWKQHQLEKTML
ncbi:TerC/Alx family metal homeostasis membrane protein [Shewanella schlegeliana]|uniref:TerC/Alx family metal homeostasis membrane protein n=1 Tax=Shewanella schlegeliana TaxID=190308 RepID=A0ABS1STB2_9GAMM|nr:TerC/Alx family metal homeostasis membrane protein [Shewanella schlegeliana]MBL4911772.1 TerC/Alx family metal homeostasis membrane protein [Shewanella schlegeliana]MCL1110275.1 TerC/Alx family metal homeostasis membrane protein [Shewanella schlegeliana]GIU35953.1 membrane protein [Shewanella schlegeliana]